MPHKENSKNKAQYYLKNNQPEKAISYLIEVGEEARQRCANETAIKHYRQALEILPRQLNGQKEEFFEARLGLGKALKLTGELKEAQETFTDALNHLENWESGFEHPIFTPTMVSTLCELGDVKQREGSFDEAMNYLEKSLHQLSETNTRVYPGLLQTVKDRIAWIHFRQGDLQKATTIATETIEEAKAAEANDSATLASLYNTLGGIFYQKGNLYQAITYTELCLKLYRELDNAWGMGVAYTNLGVLNDIKGNWSKAVEFYKQASDLQSKIGDLENKARSLDNLGALRMAMGNYEEAGENFQSALDIRQQLGENYGISQSRANLAQLALCENRFDDAACHAEVSLELAKATGGKEAEVWASWVLAMVQAESGNLGTGLNTANRAWRYAHDEGFQDEEIDCLRTLGVINSRQGEFGEAERSLQQSLDLSRKEPDPYRQGLALLELGRNFLLQAVGEVPEAVEQLRSKATKILQASIAILRPLGATKNLVQAQAALNQCSNEK